MSILAVNPVTIKQECDRFFAEGINDTLLCVFIPQQDWTISKDNRIKYYSGTVFYSCKVNFRKVPAGKQIVINIDPLTAMAKVMVNNAYAGGLWTAPYSLDITALVKEGDNDLKIEIVNNWMNRLIGDQKLPAAQRLTWCPINPYNADSPLQPSGLFGPVKIYSIPN